MQIQTFPLALLSLFLLTACQSTPKLIVSYEAIEVPAAPRPINPIDYAIKAEPAQPSLPNAGAYGGSDIRAQKLGLYAISLRKWGRGLVTAIDIREKSAAAILARQQAERDAALAQIATLKAED